MPARVHHLHLVSDSTGETVGAVMRAALVRFSDVATRFHVTVFVRNAHDLAPALAAIRQHGGLVIYTITDEALRTELIRVCEETGTPMVPVLDHVISAMQELFETEPVMRPGMQHRITSDYFKRIDALDFAINHDDGASGNRLSRADVILTGISRTSKTPTCVYLAYRGVKAANVPLVPGQDPDPAFLDAIKEGAAVIGLTASPSRLAQIRSHRLEAIGSDMADYAEIERIRSEVSDALLFFERHQLPVIDVTRRSIEETAAEILAILRQRGLEIA